MKNIKKSAGLAIYYKNKILLVHPTKSNLRNSMWGIPKGGIEEGETEMDAAVRETYEETTIDVPKHKLGKKKVIYYRKKSGKIYKTITYFECHIKSLSEIGLSSTLIPRRYLRLDEIDRIKFMNKKEAESKIFWKQKQVLSKLK